MSQKEGGGFKYSVTMDVKNGNNVFNRFLTGVFLMFLGINVSQTWRFLVDYYLLGASEEAVVI